MNETKELIDAIRELKDSIDSLKRVTQDLHTIQYDIFRDDTSHDDISSLKTSIGLLIDAINKKL